MASNPSSSNSNSSLLQHLEGLLDDKLDRVASNMLEVIQHMLEEQTERIEKSVHSLQNPNENLWRNNGKAITRAMKRYYIQHFPGPISDETTTRGFLAYMTEFDQTSGSPFDKLRRKWTRDLYTASFQSLNLVAQEQNDLKNKVDKQFRIAFRSQIVAGSTIQGVGKAQGSLKKAFDEILS